MAHRLRIVGAFAVALFASVALAQGQSANYTALMPGNASAYPNAAPAAQNSDQQGGNGYQSQGMNMNQNLGLNQNQNQNQNNQEKQKAPPPKPSYLTYTVKKKSIQQEADSGKALSVDFKSDPAGARVTVDGYYLGHTPMATKIPLGKHLVTVNKWGYESWEKEVDVAKGQSLNVNAKLGKVW